ncbi:hypothetical protein VNO77_10990 [Canavalia gladiata]|uniref:RING-type E3 ubiquitin transferase n=1 Tax=Canavalia gladiata TaxID=3824 RepID=A0AAN9MGH9_CANGL
MGNRLLLFTMVFSFLSIVQGQDREDENLPELPQTVHPSKGIVIAVLTTMFAVTFLLLLYVKFCRVRPHQLMNRNPSLQNLHGLTLSRSRVCGIDKQVIQTLPFFKFSSLKGSKEGLECTVCLSKFEDTEILRLLPKCRHGFHMNCIDTWLESHSTCPLCRRRVEAGDIKNFNYSLSSRFLRVPSNITEDLNLEIFVQREPSHRGSSQVLMDQEGDGCNWKKPVHVINHKIVVSDVFMRNRWSDLNSSDLLSLNCEMLNDICSARFSSLEYADGENFHGTSRLDFSSNAEEALNPVEKRSMSEIANVSRFAEIRCRGNRITEYGDNGTQERLWRVWLPIARRTLEWFATQETNSIRLEHKALPSNV